MENRPEKYSTPVERAGGAAGGACAVWRAARSLRAEAVGRRLTWRFMSLAGLCNGFGGVMSGSAGTISPSGFSTLMDWRQVFLLSLVREQKWSTYIGR
jgi:hypothetical protein